MNTVYCFSRPSLAPPSYLGRWMFGCARKTAGPCTISAGSQSSVHSSPPAWQQEMLAKLKDGSTHPNVRAFIAKVVMNRADVFESFAEEWFAPLAEVAASGDYGPVSTFLVLLLRVCMILLP